MRGKERSWSVVDAPKARSRDLIKVFPEGNLTLRTPKLDGETEPEKLLVNLLAEVRRRLVVGEAGGAP